MNSESKALTLILCHLNEVLKTSQQPLLDAIRPDQSLQEDLGLNSLELAELTVRIESATGVDVFKEGLVMTVRELMEKVSGRVGG